MTKLATRLLSTRIPGPINGPLKSAVEGYGLATASIRAVPDFIVIGGQRCATSSLHLYLAGHPSIGAPSMKEVHYFDTNFDRGIDWYRGHFPTLPYMELLSYLSGTPSITGEGSPYYIFHPTAPCRIADVLPDVKLLVMLRDPVKRLVSHYHHERSLGCEDLSLTDALACEPSRLAGEEDRIRRDPSYRSFSHQHHSYLARGHYAEQLERWFEIFPREQFLILESKRFFADPANAYDATLAFLGLPPAGRTEFEAVNNLAYPAVDASLLRELYDHYEPYNMRLYELLGDDFEWERARP